MATQGEQENAKDDTLFYAVDDGGGYADLATDLSQYADDMADDATWTYEDAPATRFNVASLWTIEAHCEIDNNDTGYLYHYASASNAMRLDVNGSGSIRAYLGGVLQATLALPGVDASADEFVIAWSCEPNLLTTGAGNALRSELRVYNVSDDLYAQIVWTHAVRLTSSSGDAVCWASDTAGSNSFTGTPWAIRISHGRFHPATETHEDFVAVTTAPTIAHATRIEFPIVDPRCDLADPGQFAGPVYAMGAASVRANALRSLSPIVAHDFTERTTYAGASWTGLPTAWALAGPDPLYTLFGNFLFYRPVPAFVDRLRVRVQLQHWRTSGTTMDRVHVRAYSLRRPPHPVANVVDQDAANVIHSCDASNSSNHGSGAAAGAWLELGTMRVSRNSLDHTWLALALRLEDLSGTPANNRVRLGAIAIEPVVTE